MKNKTGRYLLYMGLQAYMFCVCLFCSFAIGPWMDQLFKNFRGYVPMSKNEFAFLGLFVYLTASLMIIWIFKCEGKKFNDVVFGRRPICDI